MVDTIFADVAQPDQARIVAINAHHFLRNEGHVVISIKVGYLTLLNAIYAYAVLHASNSCLLYRFSFCTCYNRYGFPPVESIVL